jgi:hypothetical protein
LYADQFTLHETPSDKLREKSAFDAFIAFKGPAYSYEQTEGGSCSRHDATLYQNGTPVGLVEVRTRNNPKKTYSTLTIDQAKIVRLLDAADEQKLQAILIVAWLSLDNAGRDYHYVNLTFERRRGRTYKTTSQQRGDRDELPDVVSHIPIEHFKPFEVIERDLPLTVADGLSEIRREAFAVPPDRT